MYDFLIDTLHTLLKNGLTLSSALAVLVLLLKNRRLKRYINDHLPKILRDHDDERLNRIESKLDYLIELEGGTCAPISKHYDTNTPMNSFGRSTSLQTGKSTVPFIIKFMNSRRMKSMKKKFTSRKFWITVVSAGLLIAKEGLDIEVDSETILAFAGIVLTWILGESHVDAKRVQKGAESHEPNYAAGDIVGE